MLAEREQVARAQAEYLRTQIDELTGQLRELEGHLSDLDTTRQVIVSLSHGEPAPPDLLDNPAYQNILAALIEGIRSKLKRLVSRGMAIESEPGLFALNRK
jgi:hypothetical protein